MGKKCAIMSARESEVCPTVTKNKYRSDES